MRCGHCKQEISATEPIQKSGRLTYHIKCFKEMMEQKYSQNDVEIDEKKDLVSYIRILYGTDTINPKILSQIEKYHLEYEMTYRHMLLTLKYFYEIQENKVDKSYGIGIIPHVMFEAKNYYESVVASNRKNEGKNVAESISKVKVSHRDSVKPKIDLIDIDNI